MYEHWGEVEVGRQAHALLRSAFPRVANIPPGELGASKELQSMVEAEVAPGTASRGSRKASFRPSWDPIAHSY